MIACSCLCLCVCAVSVCELVQHVELAVWELHSSEEMVTGEKESQPCLHSGPMLHCEVSATRAIDPGHDP